MAVANFNVERFVSAMRVDSFARTNRFEVLVIPPVKLNNLVGGGAD
jgi:hypothetical protein